MPRLRIHRLMLASQSGSYLTSTEIKIKQFHWVCAHGRKREQLSLVSDLSHVTPQEKLVFSFRIYCIRCHLDFLICT